MTYVVTDNCIACKYTDCVEVCPVDCFYEGENMLVIHPDECIDCGVCEPECPADAIRPDTEPDMEKWVEFNRKYSELWPVIVHQEGPAARRRGARRRDRTSWRSISPKRRARAAEADFGTAMLDIAANESHLRHVRSVNCRRWRCGQQLESGHFCAI